MSNILITGATGFLGSNILNVLLETTKYNVIILKRSTSNTKRIDDLIKLNRVKCFDTDSKDRAAIINKIFTENTVTAVIHAATSYGRNDGDLTDVLDTNLAFPIEILKAAVANNTKCFINTDSYYNKFETSYRPLLDYSLSKHAFSLWLRACSDKIKGVNIILEHIFGEFDSANKFTEFVFREIVTKKSPSIDLSPGEQKRDFIYVKDAASAYVHILNQSLKEDFSFQDLQLGSGKSVSIKEFVEKVKELSGSKTQLNFGVFPYRKAEIMLSEANISSLMEIGWGPQYTLDEAIKEIINAYK